MKILLVGNYPHDRQESMARYVGMLGRGLTERGADVRVISPVPLFGKIRPGMHGIAKWLGYMDKFLVFPFAMRKASSWADVVHVCDHSNAMYVAHAGGKPCVVTCHDMLAVRSALGEFEMNPVKWTGRLLQRWIMRGMERATKVACVSETTKRELLRIGSIPEDNLVVVCNGLNYRYSPMAPASAADQVARFGIDPSARFFMHVGSDVWYKNRIGAVKIFCHIAAMEEKWRMVLVGAPPSQSLEEYIRKSGHSERIHCISGVDNEGLRALYSMSSGLIFPSLYEGFGWPIIEAQACGCPVITSNRPPMTEVGGEAAIYIDPENPIEAAETILAREESFQKQVEGGFANASKFSANAMIDAFFNLYRMVLARSDRP